MKPLKGMYLDLNKKRSLGEKFAIYFLQSELGKKFIYFFLKRFPEFFIGYFSSLFHSSLKEKFNNQKLENFEDLYWLFTSTIINRGVLRMDFDEAGYLFKIARSIKDGNILEIGRYAGGSTILLATAIESKSRLTSIDKNPQNDDELKKILKESGLLKKVNLIVDDSTSVSKEQKFDLIFIDGDHTYDGVKRDYEYWRGALKTEAHLIFHDSTHSRKFTSWQPGVEKLMNEITPKDKDYFTKVEEVGSITHFVKTEKHFN